MKILYTSDIHASKGHLFSMLTVAEKKNIDRIIIGGDIIPHHLDDENQVGVLRSQANYLEETLIPAVTNFKKKMNIPIFLDLSNDDFIHNRSILEAHDGGLFHLLHMQKQKLTDKIDIIGYMNVPPTPFGRKDWEKPDSKRQPYLPDNRISLNGAISKGGVLTNIHLDLSSDDTIARDLDQLSEIIDKPFIFVSHTPPANTPLDVIYNGSHVGSSSVYDFIKKWSKERKIIASLHGHIHESPSRSGSICCKINNVLSVNPGQGSGPYAKFSYVILKLLDETSLPTVEILHAV